MWGIRKSRAAGVSIFGFPTSDCASVTKSHPNPAKELQVRVERADPWSGLAEHWSNLRSVMCGIRRSRSAGVSIFGFPTMDWANLAHFSPRGPRSPDSPHQTVQVCSIVDRIRQKERPFRVENWSNLRRMMQGIRRSRATETSIFGFPTTKVWRLLAQLRPGSGLFDMNRTLMGQSWAKLGQDCTS